MIQLHSVIFSLSSPFLLWYHKPSSLGLFWILLHLLPRAFIHGWFFKHSAAPVQFAHPLSIKLDEKNFLLWTQQVEGVSTAHRLHCFVVNPTIPQKYINQRDLEADLPSVEYEKWLIQDQMLFTWLLSSLSDSILPLVIGCKHAYQVCDKVHSHFQSQMRAKVRQLRSELKNNKKGNRHINEYVLRIKLIVDSLVAIGDSVNEQDHVESYSGTFSWRV